MKTTANGTTAAQVNNTNREKMNAAPVVASYNNEKSRHLAALADRYGIDRPAAFYRAARRYECRLEWLAEMEAGDSRRYMWAREEFYKTQDRARRNLEKYCTKPEDLRREMWFNSDPRGYAIKLDAPAVLPVHRDFGGNYILAPEF